MPKHLSRSTREPSSQSSYRGAEVRRWHDLSKADLAVYFEPSVGDYPTAMLRISLSSIPYASHIDFTLNDERVDLTPAFPEEGGWAGSKDRRWVEIVLPNGLPDQQNEVLVSLTPRGERAEAGQGGKMITSIEIIEYGTEAKLALLQV